MLHFDLGGCPRIRILVKIEKFSQNKHSHIRNIASIILRKIRRIWAKAILGRPPRHMLVLKNLSKFTYWKVMVTKELEGISILVAEDDSGILAL